MLVKVHSNHSSKIKSHRSDKTVKIKVFLTTFAWWWKGPDPYPWLTDPYPEGSKIFRSYGSESGILSQNLVNENEKIKWSIIKNDDAVADRRNSYFTV